MNPHPALPSSVDVVVVGGGPAGIATAITLAEQGYIVLVVERSRYEGARVGEIFPPAIRQVLADLGLWESFEAAGHLPSYGVRSLWGNTDPYERSFIFDPYGTGWHVDRCAFDAYLAQAARERGVRIETGYRLFTCLPGTSRRWTLRFGSDDGSFEVEAHFVVDATGRASALARRLGKRRIFLDRLVGLFGYLMLLESAEDGWWYSAPLPQDRLVVVFMTDANLCSHASMSKVSNWISRLQNAPHTHARTVPFMLDGGIFVVGAHTSCLDRSSGRGWLAVGDSAFSFDPLSGDGVYRALKSGRRAGEAIVTAWSGHDLELSQYSRELDEEFKLYRHRLNSYYHQETRWAEAPFWMRRRKPGQVKDEAGSILAAL